MMYEIFVSKKKRVISGIELTEDSSFIEPKENKFSVSFHYVGPKQSE